MDYLFEQYKTNGAVRLEMGYATLVLTNGIAEVDPKNQEQMALVERYGGVKYAAPKAAAARKGKGD